MYQAVDYRQILAMEIYRPLIRPHAGRKATRKSSIEQKVKVTVSVPCAADMLQHMVNESYPLMSLNFRITIWATL